MDKAEKSRRVKSESSEEEEDFESADEGDESKPRPPPSLMATSPDDCENSTLESQVTKDSSINNSCKMAETEDITSIPPEGPQELEKRVDSNVESVENKSSESSESTSTLKEQLFEKECSNNPAPNTGQRQEIPKEEKKSLDDSVDDEIHFKSDDKNSEDLACELLEKTQMNETDDLDMTAEHKEAIEKDILVTDIECSDEKPAIAVNQERTDEENVCEQPPETASKPQQEQQQANSDNSWGWGGWGSMLSQASAGLSSVIETVESTLGIPDPEEFAKQVHEDEKSEQKLETVVLDEPTVSDSQSQPPIDNSSQAVAQTENGQGSYFSLFGVPGLSSVVSEGLGALEYIGKKTMDVISDGDPGLRSTREQLIPKGPTLSQMLREAKEQAEYKAAHPDYKESIMNVKLTTEFDTYQGLAHLEALEILSKEAEIKVEDHIINLSKDELMSIKPLLRTIQDVVQIEDEVDDDEDEQQQDFESEMVTCLAELNLTHIPNKTKSVHTKAKEWIDSCLKDQTEDPKCRSHVDIYTAAIATLAELTACSVEQFHKIAEVMLLLAEESDTSALVRAQTLKKMTVCVCRELSNLASQYATSLNNLSKESEDPEAVESLITTLYLESSDSSRYVQHAFKLMCPVLQQASLSETTSTKCS